VLFVALALTAACTGTQRPTATVAAGEEGGLLGGTSPSSTTGPGVAHGPEATSPPSTGTTGVGGGTITSTGPAGAGSAVPPIQPVNIYPAGSDRIGITDTQVNVCVHAALQLGAVFNNTPADLRVYWDMVNAAGGVHGRRVNVFFTDDQGSPQGGVQAAQQCKANDAFIMGGSIGFDTVPAVREFVEQNDMLYLSSFATEADISRYQRSFTFLPSIERLGNVAGQYAASSFSGRDFGVIWRNSPNWQGGRDQFRAALESDGQAVVADVPVEKNQGDFTSAILTLRQSGAEVVLAWVGVLEIAQLVKQARIQNYQPTWIVPGFNLVTDTLGHDIDGTNGPAAVGFQVNPPYPADPGAAYQAEIDRMTAAFAQFRPSKNGQINDTDWSFWLYSMQLHRLLDDCGRDCSRNRLAGMFLAGYRADIPPSCPMDFTRGGGRLGGFGVEIYSAMPNGGGARWSSTARCAEGF
jgi:ABC-type branched-subunit amino acid transport system substrate-binding protein